MWNRLGDNKKAGENPKRFLREKLQILGDNDIVNLKLCKSKRLQIHRAAFRLGLCAESRNVPLKFNGWRSLQYEKFMVVGRREPVLEKRHRDCLERLFGQGNEYWMKRKSKQGLYMRL